MYEYSSGDSLAVDPAVIICRENGRLRPCNRRLQYVARAQLLSNHAHDRQVMMRMLLLLLLVLLLLVLLLVLLVLSSY